MPLSCCCCCCCWARPALDCGNLNSNRSSSNGSPSFGLSLGLTLFQHFVTATSSASALNSNANTPNTRSIVSLTLNGVFELAIVSSIESKNLLLATCTLNRSPALSVSSAQILTARRCVSTLPYLNSFLSARAASLLAASTELRGR